MRANELKEVIDVDKLTIGDALLLKLILGLSNSEATALFLRRTRYENVSI